MTAAEQFAAAAFVWLIAFAMWSPLVLRWSGKR